MPTFLSKPLKSKVDIQGRLLRFRLVVATIVLFSLLFPYVFQQSFFPFFRFGMFAEPVTRSIQKEYFLLAGIDARDRLHTDLYKFSGIRKSRMDYLLRNYFYRKEVDYLMKETAQLLPEDVPFDTLIMLRILDGDTTEVAHYGL